MWQFVEQGTLRGAWKGGGSSTQGSLPVSPYAAVVVKPCGAQPPEDPYPSYPVCWETLLNPAPREDAALHVWDCGDSRGLPLGLGEMCPCLQPHSHKPVWLLEAGLCLQAKGLQEEGSSLRSTRDGTEEMDHHLMSVVFENTQVRGELQGPSVPTEGGTFVFIGLEDGDSLTAEAGEL